jgi:hypothetical protein
VTFYTILFFDFSRETVRNGEMGDRCQDMRVRQETHKQRDKGHISIETNDD